MFLFICSFIKREIFIQHLLYESTVPARQLQLQEGEGMYRVHWVLFKVYDLLTAAKPGPGSPEMRG